MSDKVISFEYRKQNTKYSCPPFKCNAFTYGWSNLISYYSLDILAIRS